MTAFNRILDTIRIKAPGAVDGAILLELFSAIDHACRRSDIYIEQVPVPLVVGTFTYTVPSPSGISAIPTAVYSLSHATYSTQSVTYDPETRQLTLVDVLTATDATQPLFVTAKFAPDPTFTLTSSAVQGVLPAYLWDRHFAMLADGALARLFSQVAKPYANQQAAALHARMFRNALSQAKSEQVKGHMPGGQAWAFPSFA